MNARTENICTIALTMVAVGGAFELGMGMFSILGFLILTNMNEVE